MAKKKLKKFEKLLEGSPKEINDLPPEKRLSMMRSLGLDDLYFFNKNIMGFKDVAKQPHMKLSTHLTQSDKKRKMYLLPRGSFKSSFVTVGYTCWMLQRDRSTRVLISHHTYERCKLFLKQIKESLTSDLMVQLYGDPRRRVGGKVQDWTKTAITLKDPNEGKHGHFAKKEASVEITSPESGDTGTHFDIAILDDVVSKKNVGTQQQIDKVIEHYREIEPILDPGAELIVIGTTWADNDLYDHIEQELSSMFEIMKMPAILEDGGLLFPSVLTREHLEEKKTLMGEAMFEAQYMLNPFSSATTVFSKDDIKVCTSIPDHSVKFLKVDPAISDLKGSSDTGMVVVAKDHQDNVFLEAYYQGKLNEMKIAKTIIDYAITYDVDAIILESVIFQRLLCPLLNQEMKERDKYFAIIDVKGVVTNKHLRILSFQPVVQSGKFFVKDDIADEIKTLLSRYQFRSEGKGIDVIDTLCSYNDRLFPPDPEEAEEKEYDIRHYIDKKRQEEAKKVIDSILNASDNKGRHIKMEARYI